MSKSKQNYADFLHADYGHSFAEWLGIEVPEIEYHPRNWKLVRMVSRKNKYKGDYWNLPYFSTKKEAKADYKQRQKIAAQKNKEAVENIA
jgi:hypothetical protein